MKLHIHQAYRNGQRFHAYTRDKSGKKLKSAIFLGDDGNETVFLKRDWTYFRPFNFEVSDPNSQGFRIYDVIVSRGVCIATINKFPSTIFVFDVKFDHADARVYSVHEDLSSFHEVFQDLRLSPKGDALGYDEIIFKGSISDKYYFQLEDLGIDLNQIEKTDFSIVFSERTIDETEYHRRRLQRHLREEIPKIANKKYGIDLTEIRIDKLTFTANESQELKAEKADKFETNFQGLDANRTPLQTADAFAQSDRKAEESSLMTCSFQVALSFAGEQRDYVREVAKALAARHIAVFYDEFQANTLWGKDGTEYFHQIYSRDTQYVVMFISTDYVAKAWTRHERRSAISRQIRDDAEYILPVRFDDTEVPGLPDTLQYLAADRFTPAELAVEIARKIGVRPTSGKASDVPPPASAAMSGEVTFDYSAHNGRFVIGNGAAVFETAWSKASDKRIYLLNDPPSIHGVAHARGASEIHQVRDALDNDFTSRHRAINVGDVAVLRNVNDFYAAVQVLQIEDDSRGSESDALTVRYVILPTGETDFGMGLTKA